MVLVDVVPVPVVLVVVVCVVLAGVVVVLVVLVLVVVVPPEGPDASLATATDDTITAVRHTAIMIVQHRPAMRSNRVT